MKLVQFLDFIFHFWKNQTFEQILIYLFSWKNTWNTTQIILIGYINFFI